MKATDLSHKRPTVTPKSCGAAYVQKLQTALARKLADAERGESPTTRAEDAALSVTEANYEQRSRRILQRIRQ